MNKAKNRPSKASTGRQQRTTKQALYKRRKKERERDAPAKHKVLPSCTNVSREQTWAKRAINRPLSAGR